MAEFKEYLAAVLADEDKLAEVAEVGFKECDKDESGKINRAELSKAIQAMSAEFKEKPIPEDEIDKIYEGLDTSGDGLLDVKEFTVLVKSLMQGLHDAL